MCAVSISVILTCQQLNEAREKFNFFCLKKFQFRAYKIQLVQEFELLDLHASPSYFQWMSRNRFWLATLASKISALGVKKTRNPLSRRRNIHKRSHFSEHGMLVNHPSKMMSVRALQWMETALEALWLCRSPMEWRCCRRPVISTRRRNVLDRITSRNWPIRVMWFNNFELFSVRTCHFTANLRRRNTDDGRLESYKH